MFRPIVIATVLGMAVFLCTLGSANAAKYCARYLGGHERMTSGAHAHCIFATLEACRASVRARGGGH
jgi:hypothetical protein